MIKIIQNGNLFDSKCKVFINACNTIGTMGRGIALEFKNRFPNMYYDYFLKCVEKKINIGAVDLWRSDFCRIGIINFPTKKHWRDPSKIEWIISGLEDLKEVIFQENIESVAIPKLGCGLGGLNWDDVKPLILKTMKDIENYNKDFIVEIYE